MESVFFSRYEFVIKSDNNETMNRAIQIYLQS
jgi:hypothetical protein